MRDPLDGYPDQETAFAEADKLDDFYQLEYPDVAASSATEIDQAITQIKILYRLTATPDMKVTDGLLPGLHGPHGLPGLLPLPRRRPLPGRRTATVTTEVIPVHLRHLPHVARRSGRAVASLPLGQPPATHDDSLWVFNHRDVATSRRPGRPELRRVPRPGLLHQLPQDRRGQRGARRDGDQPRPGDPGDRATRPAPTATSRSTAPAATPNRSCRSRPSPRQACPAPRRRGSAGRSSRRARR